jgi:hypothetical protein
MRRGPPVGRAECAAAGQGGQMTDLITTPIRASRHLAIWLVWHSIGVSLIEEQSQD